MVLTTQAFLPSFESAALRNQVGEMRMAGEEARKADFQNACWAYGLAL
jgi:hypothetical protein